MEVVIKKMVEGKTIMEISSKKNSGGTNKKNYKWNSGEGTNKRKGPHDIDVMEGKMMEALTNYRGIV